MSASDPDIVGLMKAVETSGFGPLTKDALNDQLQRASKCNGGPGDDNIRFMLLSAVRFSLAEPERQTQAFAVHQGACARVAAVEGAVAELKKTVQARGSGSDIACPLPRTIFGDNKEFRVHGAVAYAVMFVALVLVMGWLHVKSESNRKEDLAPIKAALHNAMTISGLEPSDKVLDGRSAAVYSSKDKKEN